MVGLFLCDRGDRGDRGGRGDRGLLGVTGVYWGRTFGALLGITGEYWGTPVKRALRAPPVKGAARPQKSAPPP